MLAKDQLPEVPVCRDQKGLAGVGAIEDEVIGKARRHLGHIVDLVPVRPKPRDNGGVYALVGEQVHGAVVGSG